MLILMMMMAANKQQKKQQSQQQPQEQQQQQQQQQQSAARNSCGADDREEDCNPHADQEVGKSSNSSNETVIARLDDGAPLSSGNTLQGGPREQLEAHTTTSGGEEERTMLKKSAHYKVNSPRLADSQQQQHEGVYSNNSNKKTSRLKSFLLFTTAHLNPFHHNHGQAGEQSPVKVRKSSNDDSTCPSGKQRASGGHQLALLELAQRYFGRNSHSAAPATSRSAPVTPVKWRPLEATAVRANGLTDCGRAADTCAASAGQVVSAKPAERSLQPARPSVRFAESSDERRKRWTKAPSESEGGEEEPKEANDGDEQANLVERLFAAPLELRGEAPMDSDKFRQHGYSLIDYISNYLDTIDKRRVTPLNIEPGYLKSLIQASAPERGEPFANIMHDFENHIMCGITHWQHPHFHAYFPAGNAYPSILADMLSDALGCVGFSWAASPAYTELEIIMLDWMGKMIGLPDEFLCLSGSSKEPGGKESKGGGVIQGSASECVLVNLLAARHWAMDKLRKKYPNTPDGLLLTKLVGYCSKEAHSCVEKAAMIGFIRMRALDTDDKHSLRGETLERAIATDMSNGLEPFLVCATLGTTSCCSFDNLEELGLVCQKHDIWLQVDAAYAGSALICPEFKHLMKGIELVTSFNMNPNKWMLINFDCSLMWVKDRFKLTRAFVVDPLYLQHSFSDQAIDYRHWGIPLSRRFRALKLWFVIRNYGVEGLQAYIRNHVKLAKLFEQLIRQDQRFMITNEVVLGLVCFRLIGSNALNQRLLSMINASGKLHMVPASVNGRYVIRFCVCDQNAKDTDIRYAYRCISDFASELFESIKAGKERIRAISQQNTIDVSSVSLHTQQSASVDRLNNMAASGDLVASSGEPQAQQQHQQQAVSPREAARQYLVMRRNSRHGDNSAGAGEPPTRWSPAPGSSVLVKQASMVQEQQQVTTTGNGDEEDLEQEIVLDSLATIDGLDYDLDLDDDDDDDLPLFDHDEPDTGAGGQAATPSNDAAERASTLEWRSPVARRWHSRAANKPIAGRAASTLAHNQHGSLTGHASAGTEQEEADDEVFTLAERRNRMSLRYKREFFVRVVSDPRVYRASISGDINAHASCCSLGGPQQNQNLNQNGTTNNKSDESSRQNL